MSRLELRLSDVKRMLGAYTFSPNHFKLGVSSFCFSSLNGLKSGSLFRADLLPIGHRSKLGKPPGGGWCPFRCPLSPAYGCSMVISPASLCHTPSFRMSCPHWERQKTLRLFLATRDKKRQGAPLVWLLMFRLGGANQPSDHCSR